MTKQSATIILLTGLKGAGKTTLGTALAQELGLVFLRVEPIYLEVVRAHPELASPDLEPLGFGAILAEVQEIIQTQPVICLESTGTAGYFPIFLEHLRRLARVRLVRVVTPAEMCLERVRTRDSANHIPVSDHRLREINRMAATVSLPWDAEVPNSNPTEQKAAIAAIAALLK